MNLLDTLIGTSISEKDKRTTSPASPRPCLLYTSGIICHRHFMDGAGGIHLLRRERDAGRRDRHLADPRAGEADDLRAVRTGIADANASIDGAQNRRGELHIYGAT